MVNEEEELYFRENDARKREALRKKMASEAAALEERRAVAESTGADTDISILDRILALGFNGDSARIFDLMPLVHVAWADGKIQKGERAMILGLLDARLASRPYLLGEAFTLTDLIVGGGVGYGTLIGVPADDHPHVLSWLSRLRARDSYKKSMSASAA